MHYLKPPLWKLGSFWSFSCSFDGKRVVDRQLLTIIIAKKLAIMKLVVVVILTVSAVSISVLDALKFCSLFNCSWTQFIAIIVNVCVFFMQNFRLTILTFRVTFTPLIFCVSRDLKFSLYHNFKQLNSIGCNLILKVKWKVRRNWCHFLL